MFRRSRRLPRGAVGVLGQERDAAAHLSRLGVDDAGAADLGVDLGALAEVDELDAVGHRVLEDAVLDAQIEPAAVAPVLASIPASGGTARAKSTWWTRAPETSPRPTMA